MIEADQYALMDAEALREVMAQQKSAGTGQQFQAATDFNMFA